MKFFFLLLKRDLRTRFAGSALGSFWFFLQPFLNFVVYAAVFGTLFKFHVSFKGKTIDFLPFFLAGFWPWMAFQEGLARCSNVLAEYAHILKKVHFKLEFLVPVAIASPQVYIFLGFLGLIFFLILGYDYRLTNFTYSFLFFLPLFIQLSLSLGLGLLIAIFGAYIRDIPNWLPAILNLWFFATPIFYSSDQIPKHFLWVLKLNPMVPILASYREIFFSNCLSPRNLIALSKVLLFSILLIFLGLFLFRRGKRWLSDVL